MNFAGARTLFASYVLNEDTENKSVSDTDRDTLINEAVLAYHARFAGNFKYTNDLAGGTNNVFNMGLAGDLQWIEHLSIERKVATNYLPLRNAGADGWAKIRMLHRTENVPGPPTQYGIALVSRDIINTRSIFSVAVYPSPAANTTYRARYRPYAAELSGVNDVLPLDEAQCDAAVRIAALNAGLVLGYSGEWAQKLLTPLNDEERTLVELTAAASKYTPPGGRG